MKRLGIVVGGLNDIGNGSSDFKAQCSLVNKYNVMTNFIGNISNSTSMQKNISWKVSFTALEYTNMEYCTQWDLIDESAGCCCSPGYLFLSSQRIQQNPLDISGLR